MCFQHLFLNLWSVVDNLNPTEIVVSYSAVCRWLEPPLLPMAVEEKKSHSSLKGKDKDTEKEMSAGTSSSLLEGMNGLLSSDG